MSTPILTELAAPVLLMAEAFVGHQVSVGQSTKADENVAALVAFKRALKEVDVPAPTFTVPPTEMPANDMARLEHRTRMRGELLNGLARAINATSTENASNTPDFILANFVAACLDAFAEASLAREAWYGKSLSISGESQSVPAAPEMRSDEIDIRVDKHVFPGWTALPPGDLRDKIELISDLWNALYKVRAVPAQLAAKDEEVSQLHMRYREASVNAFAAIRRILKLDDVENLQGACQRIMDELAALTAQAEKRERNVQVALDTGAKALANMRDECDALRAELASAKAESVRLDDVANAIRSLYPTAVSASVFVNATDIEVEQTYKPCTEGSSYRMLSGEWAPEIAAVRAAQEAGNATH